MTSQQPGPGFIAISRDRFAETMADLTRITGALGAQAPTFERLGDRIGLALWGLSGQADGDTSVYHLTRGARLHESELSDEAVRELVEPTTPLAAIGEVMPPFGALRTSKQGELMAVTDSIGARHVYHCLRSHEFGASTDPKALAMAIGSSLDTEAVAVQSVLGWQVASRTLFAGVGKLPARSFLTLDRNDATLATYSDNGPPPSTSIGEAVSSAASLLRSYLSAYLDDHPDATLQLTGGQDSRILLSAIPRSRRRGMNAMTLMVPGSDDVAIAAQLADRYSMKHCVVTLDGLDDWTSAEAYERVLAACNRLGCMADPLALAALVFAESKIDQGPRVSGLGGEVARGFYYVLPSLRIPVTPRTVTQLAKWRMFANESVASAALEAEFHQWAQEFAQHEIYRLLLASGHDLRTSSDDFYLSQRMERWAGLTDSAVCFDREVVNPMLDRRFLDIARGMAPADKRNSRFLSRLQVELDDELADIPLDRRPPPRAYAASSGPNIAMRGKTFALRALGKSAQRLRGDRKSAAGGALLAAKVIDYWREHPEVLGALDGNQIVRSSWIDDVLTGKCDPDAATTAFVMNLVVASGVLGDRTATR